MGKLNAPVVYGGPELTVKVVNNSFRLNIKKYVRISILDMIELVDIIDGIDVELTEDEAYYIDLWIQDVKKITHRSDEVPLLKNGGIKHLNGLQTVTHARNRTMGYMVGRENRFNQIILAIVHKVRDGKNIFQIVRLISRLFKYVETNIGIIEWMRLIAFGIDEGKYCRFIFIKRQDEK